MEGAWRFCVAPMMRYSHRHARQFWRLLCPPALLYTEMLTADAVRFGPRERLLALPSGQSPVALQLAGNQPAVVAEAAKIGEDYGYAEINLNCGCPSPRVQNGDIGACLMAKPATVAAMVEAIRRAVQIPVTVKCRLAIDDMDCASGLDDFVRPLQAAGCNALIVHARRAWLKGLNPAQNRRVPPLDYARVHRLKADFPTLPIILNGGLNSTDEAAAHLSAVDGVMLGRAICRRPYLLAEVVQRVFAQTPPSRRQVVLAMLDYVGGLPMGEWRRALMPLIGLYHGMPNNKYYRRCLSGAPATAVKQLLETEQWA